MVGYNTIYQRTEVSATMLPQTKQTQKRMVGSISRPTSSGIQRSGPLSRLAARMRPAMLDGQLTAGADPLDSARLSARAAVLISSRHRAAIASSLERLLESPARRARMQVAPRRSVVLANEPRLRALADRLLSDEPLYARGIARLELLLGDGTGPVYGSDRSRLATELSRVEAELSGAWQRPAACREAVRTSVDPSGFVGYSFVLPDGSWFHGRREAS
jgi:hypothetical protein